MKSQRSLSSLIALFLVAGCSTTPSSRIPASSYNVEGISLDREVTSQQAQQISDDIEAFKKLSWSNPDPQMKILMQLNDASSASLMAWLQSRVHYIVSSDMDLKARGTIADLGLYNYPNLDQNPTVEMPTKVPDGTTTVKTVMTNIGGALYYAGKKSGHLLGLRPSSFSNTISVTSPRVGILEIGDGLFMTPSVFAGLPKTSQAYLAFRMSTLFHEARHSDGNGASLGFFHAVCADGDYAGYSACDRNLNGPYSVEFHLVNSMDRSCGSCSTSEHHGIQAIALDDSSRVIKFTADPNGDPNAAAQVAQVQLDTCQIFVEYKVTPLPDYCKNLAALRKQISNPSADQGTPSTNWDATPEGGYAALEKSSSSSLAEQKIAPADESANSQPLRAPAFDFSAEPWLTEALNWSTDEWKKQVSNLLSQLPKKSELIQLKNNTKEEIALQSERLHHLPQPIMAGAMRVGELTSKINEVISKAAVRHPKTADKIVRIGLDFYSGCVATEAISTSLRALCYLDYVKFAGEHHKAEAVKTLKAPKKVRDLAMTLVPTP